MLRQMEARLPGSRPLGRRSVHRGRPAKKTLRKQGSRHKSASYLPAKLRWSDAASELTIDEHGHDAGLAGRWRISNPTRGDQQRLRWLVAWEKGRIEGGWPLDNVDYSERAA